MSLTLSPETEKFVADAVSTLGYASADELVRVAVGALVALPGGQPTDEELDALLDEDDRHGGVPLDRVRAELVAEFGTQTRTDALAAAVAVGIGQADRGELAPWDPAEVRREVARQATAGGAKGS